MKYGTDEKPFTIDEYAGLDCVVVSQEVGATMGLFSRKEYRYQTTPVGAVFVPTAADRAVVVPAAQVPEMVALFSKNGGDEDYVVVCPARLRSHGEYIAERLAICDYELHLVGDVCLFITNHA